MNVTVRPRHSFRFRSRSFMAFVLTPEPPVADWMAELDQQIGRSEGFFIGRPVVLDLADVRPTGPERIARTSHGGLYRQRACAHLLPRARG